MKSSKQFSFLIFNPIFGAPHEKFEKETFKIEQRSLEAVIKKTPVPSFVKEFILDDEPELDIKMMVPWLNLYENLIHLGLNKCNIEDLSFLNNIKSPIIRLALDHNPITVENLSPIKKFALCSLSLINCRLDFSLKTLNKALDTTIFALTDLITLNLYMNPALVNFTHQEYLQYRSIMFSKLRKLVYLECLVRLKGAEILFVDQKRKHLLHLENDELSRWDLYQESDKSAEEEEDCQEEMEQEEV